MNWLELAACRGKPTAWWYPERGEHFRAGVAVLVCRSCPVRRQCLDAAIAEEAVVDGPASGIRGGYTAAARVALRRRRSLRRVG